MGGRAFRILLVEDSRADVHLLKVALQEAGLAVELTVFEDGVDALGFLRDPKGSLPDLALIDLNLPRKGGMEVLQTVRQNHCMPAMPIAVLTSSPSPVDRARMEQLGVISYLTKPPDLAGYMHLGAVLKEILIECGRQRAPGGMEPR
jgi:CheY-like chemotaxis protein